MMQVEPGRLRPGSRPGSRGPGTPRVRESPRVPLSSTADGLSSYLAKLDDLTYFSAMRADILSVQRRLRAFATPVKGGEVSEASLQLIVGGSNPLHAKVALHELLQDKMMQLERAVVLATADGVPGEENVPLTPTANTRLSYYVNLLDRLQRMHAHIVADAADAADAPGANAMERINELMMRVQERDRLNATLERELGELQARMSSHEADVEHRLEAARAEGVAAERERAAVDGARSDAERSAATEGMQRLEAEVERLRGELASAHEAEARVRAQPAATPALAPEREQELLARITELEAAVAERDATVVALRAVSDASEAKAGEAATTAEEQLGVLQRRFAELERELKHEKVSSKNAQIYLQTRIDNLTQQLEQTAADGDDKSALKHVQAENDRLEAQVQNLQSVLDSTKKELEMSSKPPSDSFEEVMIEELRNMRESFEAKLSVANETMKDRHATHRREIRELKEAFEKERAAMESRINYLNAKLPSS
mmetsp:Transcript_12133/g.31745  ORF Transcript_12133/g.31745 Transcript_12133/m.31745 type:complete len:489 (-) Transcript_12133:274-1740(-)